MGRVPDGTMLELDSDLDLFLEGQIHNRNRFCHDTCYMVLAMIPVKGHGSGFGPSFNFFTGSGY